jgi:hypothetical protein
MIYITMYPLTQRINHNAQTHTDYGGGRGGGDITIYSNVLVVISVDFCVNLVYRGQSDV